MASGSDGCTSLMSSYDTSANRNIPISIFISEKKVLPFTVLLVGGIYAAVAATFIFE